MIKNTKMNLELIYHAPFTTGEGNPCQVYDRDGIFVLETDHPYLADKLIGILNEHSKANENMITVAFDNYSEVPDNFIGSNYFRMVAGTITQ